MVCLFSTLRVTYQQPIFKQTGVFLLLDCKALLLMLQIERRELCLSFGSTQHGFRSAKESITSITQTGVMLVMLFPPQKKLMSG
jgi:hypothetical protein